MVKLKKLLLVFGVCFIPSLASVSASSGVNEFERKKMETLSSFSETKAQRHQRFEQSKQAYLNAFNRVKEELATKWDNPELTSKTQWIQYANDDTVKRSVNFETGVVVIEVLDDNLSADEVDKIVQHQIKELETQTTQQAFANDKVLAANNVRADNDIASIKVFSKLDVTKVLSSQNRESYRQQNGLSISRVSMAVSQNTVKSRAKTYMPYVYKISNKWNVEPALILAIMHTESHFNPMAQSHIPAYGLMQVVPTSAGKDVTKRYLGEEKLLPPEVLFNPEFNIDIGTSYLNILDKHYLKRVEHNEVRTYLMISSYNGGVGAVAKHFSGKAKLSSLPSAVNGMSPTEVYTSLVNDFPFKETRNYLKKVQEKRLYYKNVLNSQSI
ncbi:transglycosylase SLT domain-containing protein [Vibrio lentus]|uniref:transglycosylase SLT domain-containing protein n=1 Tax=Vibrio lentus TaxID=136468 RepID=UPI001E2CE350|nr:transglycosylase SLT domain-containing protein [Vibrio lentus]MCC4835228.1 transglycosylase SLT domain-containing protein [Vibrio lentus]